MFSPLTANPVDVNPEATATTVDPVDIFPVEAFSIKTGRTEVIVDPVDTDDRYTGLRASISSLQSSVSTSHPFSTHTHSNAVSRTLGPCVFAFAKSFFEICSCVHSL